MTEPELEESVAPTGTVAQTDRPLPVELQPEEPGEPSAAYEACVEEIRRRYGSDIPYFFPHLEDLIRRRLGVAPLRRQQQHSRACSASASGWVWRFSPQSWLENGPRFPGVSGCRSSSSTVCSTPYGL